MVVFGFQIVEIMSSKCKLFLDGQSGNKCKNTNFGNCVAAEVCVSANEVCEGVEDTSDFCYNCHWGPALLEDKIMDTHYALKLLNTQLRGCDLWKPFIISNASSF